MKRGIKMTQWIDWASIGSFLSHVAVGLGLLFIGGMVFELTTKFNDRELIKKGNVAVALKLWGKGIGLAIVIFTVWSNSLNLVDATLWGVVGIITQVVAYWVIEFIMTPKTSLAKKVEEGNVAVGVTLFAASVAVGLIVAGSLTY
jgi:putative membrane protein